MSYEMRAASRLGRFFPTACLLAGLAAGWAAPAAWADPATRPAKALSAGELAARACYDQLVKAYLTNDLTELEAQLKASAALVPQMGAEQRLNVAYIRTAAAEERPKWWASTKSASNCSFQCSMWGRTVMANFVPADDLGFHNSVGIRNGQVVSVVSWRPTNVDNPRPAEGNLAVTMGVTKGDIGEAIVWHELGHQFMTAQLSADAAVELYTNHEVLFGHLQEFFADMTAVHHATPPARRVSLVARLSALDPPGGKYRELEPHTRAAHAIGGMFIEEVLANRTKWPSVHLPAAVPERDVELKTIIYVYEHFTNAWTVEEDQAMRDWSQKVVRTQGDQIFRSKGMIPLPDKNTFSLMEAQDREFQKKRDAWVTEKLKQAITAGQVDPAPAAAPRTDPFDLRNLQRVEVPDY